MKNYRILITGSEGLIGKELVKKLKNMDYSIEEIDLKTGQDVLNKKLVEEKIKKVHGVVHLAGISRVITAYEKPLETVVNNVLGTTNILESIRKYNPSCWIIFGSSREVYGEKTISVKETEIPKPINVYGSSKLACESLCLSYKDNYSLHTFIVRFSNIYGNENDHQDRVIPRFFKLALTHGDITIFGGKQILDFVYIDDAISAIITLIEKIISKNIPNKTNIFHFVTGKGTKIVELAEKIIQITKSKSKIKFFERRNYDVDEFVGDPRFVADVLGWQAQTSLDEGLKKYFSKYPNIILTEEDKK
jgi:nucleoside-diphosphate-sugar epimerase